MKEQEKDIFKIRLGLAFLKVIQENKVKAEQNKIEGVKDIHLIDSLRKLEAASGIPYASIHRISVGTKNAGFTTIAVMVEGLNLKLDDFFARYYYSVGDKEIERYLKVRNGPAKKGAGKPIGKLKSARSKS